VIHGDVIACSSQAFDASLGFGGHDAIVSINGICQCWKLTPFFRLKISASAF
jgi:hypothetical protein